jgi:protease I
MTQELTNKKIAILVANGFEQVEMTKPKQAFEEAGATTEIISLNSDKVQGWNHFDRADFFDVDVPLNAKAIELFAKQPVAK